MSNTNNFIGSYISESQYKQIQDFMSECRKDNRYEGTVGGRFTYKITPTSLGTIIKVLDNFSKKEIDVTDYEVW